MSLREKNANPKTCAGPTEAADRFGVMSQRVGLLVSLFIASETDIGMVKSADGERSGVRDRRGWSATSRRWAIKEEQRYLQTQATQTRRSRGFRQVGCMESMAIVHR